MSVALMDNVGSGGRAVSGTAHPSLALRTCGSGEGVGRQPDRRPASQRTVAGSQGPKGENASRLL